MRSMKILQREHGEMSNRPISYQNALMSFGSKIKVISREKVLVHWREE